MARSRVIDKDKGYANFKRLLAASEKLTVVVGLMGNGEGDEEEGGITPAEYGAYNEFGVPSKNIPSRPFMRTTLEENKKTIARDFKRNLVRLAVRNVADPAWAFERVGENYADKLREAIEDWSQPPNAPSTIKKKGFNDPLIDTKAMLEADDYEVRGR